MLTAPSPKDHLAIEDQARAIKIVLSEIAEVNKRFSPFARRMEQIIETGLKELRGQRAGGIKVDAKIKVHGRVALAECQHCNWTRESGTHGRSAETIVRQAVAGHLLRQHQISSRESVIQITIGRKS